MRPETIGEVRERVQGCACLALLLLACATAPEVRPPPTPEVRAAPEPNPPPYCHEFDRLHVEAYWSPLPWTNEGGGRWIRIESRAPYGELQVLQEPRLQGCRESRKLAPPPYGVPFLHGCLPEEDATEIELTAEYACRLGAGHKRVQLQIENRPAESGERLPLKLTVTPETPAVEMNGGEELLTWRSRAEVPGWLADSVPADFDFEQYMLSGPDLRPSGTEGTVILTPTQPPIRAEHVLIVKYRYPEPDCPVCSGVHRKEPLGPIKREPVRLWKLPRQEGKVFERVEVTLCPPCSAP